MIDYITLYYMLLIISCNISHTSQPSSQSAVFTAPLQRVIIVLIGLIVLKYILLALSSGLQMMILADKPRTNCGRTADYDAAVRLSIDLMQSALGGAVPPPPSRACPFWG